MFGNVKPFKPEMRIKEYETYKSVYCALCKALGKDYGVASRMILSYDVTFLALVGISANGGKMGIKKGRCVCNPMKKCLYCTENDEIFHFSAAVAVILFYYKLKDNIADDGFFGKILSYMLSPYASAKRKKAMRKYPEVDEISKQMMESQLKAEKNPDCSIDEAAEPTAHALSQLAKMISSGNNKNEFERFGYHLGKWIYLTDALADLQDDIKNRSFNPFLLKKTADTNEVRQYANGIINISAAELADSYIELDLQGLSPIIENIIILGLRDSQKRAFEKETKKND